MADKFHHEAIYRGSEQLARLADQRLPCAVRVVGSHLADNLARQGFRQLRVIDRDRVEEHNVGTQLYGESEVGAWKVEALRNRLFRATGVEIDVASQRARRPHGTVSPAKWRARHRDVFDNSTSRRLVQEHCLAGIALPACRPYSDYGEVVWDELSGAAEWPAMFAITHSPAIWYYWCRRHFGDSGAVRVIERRRTAR